MVEIVDNCLEINCQKLKHVSDEQFLTLVGVEHELTLAYSKEENAIVERFNKKLIVTYVL